jgi:hypothetical protein
MRVPFGVFFLLRQQNVRGCAFMQGLHQSIAVFEHGALVDGAFVRHFAFVDGRWFTEQHSTGNA